MKDFVKNLKYNLPAGLVVFLVAVPLCLGIALASGAPMFAGIIAGIVGGIVVGSVSGSNISVSGPAAGLTVIVLNALDVLGTFEAFLLAVVLAGVLQIIMGFAKAGAISHYFPSSVIKGMLAAIGIILIKKQIPHAFGYDADYKGNEAFVQADQENIFSELINMLGFLEPGAIIISVLALATMILWDTPKLKKFTFFKVVPGALVAVLLGVVLNQLYQVIAPKLFLSGNHLVSLPMAETVIGFVDNFRYPDFSAIMNYQVYLTAFTLAVIASIESLLSIEASDKLDPEKRTTNTNRELKAQGIGNIVSGLIGGLPVTSVIVRSSANVSSGAKTKASAIFHGILLLVSAVFIPHILNLIPLSALAAVLLIVGYKLAKVSIFKEMYRLGWDQLIPFVVTILAIVVTDLLIGIMVGMSVAVFFILRNNYKAPYEMDEKEHHEDKDAKKITIELSEHVTFINKRRMMLTLEEIPHNSTVMIDGTKSRKIDHDVLEIIHKFHETAKNKNINLETKNIKKVELANSGH